VSDGDRPAGRSPSDTLHDAVGEVRHPGCLDRAELFKLQVRADSVEQTRAVAENHRSDVQLELVDEAGRQVLVDDLCAAADHHVLAFGCLLRLRERGFDSLGHEREGGVRKRQRLALVVGDDVDGHVEGRIVAPPTVPGIVAPGAAFGRAELAAAHDFGADARDRLLDDGRALVDLAALPAVLLPPGLQLDDPVVERFATLAERVGLALVRPGDVAVGGNRDVRSHLAHVSVDASSGRNSSVTFRLATTA
jgi:hypothetical protein